MENPNIKNQIVIKNSKIFAFAVFVLIFGFCFLNFHSAHAAILYSQAANQDVYQGQNFVVDWYLDSEGVSLNTIDLKLNFSKSNLSVAQTTTGNSVVSVWVKNPIADN